MCIIMYRAYARHSKIIQSYVLKVVCINGFIRVLIKTYNLNTQYSLGPCSYIATSAILTLQFILL